MSSERFVLSPKYKEFLKYNSARVEFLEGTTAAGKTTVGIVKFFFKVAKSPKKIHLLCGLDTGTVEKNIINKDLGVLDIFGDVVEYRGNGSKDDKIPHVLYHTNDGDKIIYILGYGDKAKWKKSLGSQYGCLYIDEINIADMDFIRETSMRCDYLMATLNPDDPNLDVYKQYINHSRPLERYINDAPPEIMAELTEEPKSGWIHWFFSFEHNNGLTKEKKEQIIDSVPVGTKIYKNKILGVRGKSTGLVFFNFDRKKHTQSKEWLKKEVKDGKIKFIQFSAGLDTAYSDKSPDTFSMLYLGIDNTGRLWVLDEQVYNNAKLDEKNHIAPSTLVELFIDFLNYNKDEYGLARDVFIDNADQATIKELKKHRMNHGCIYTFINAWKKTKIIDRINHQIGWIAHEQYIVLDHCKEHIRELESYSWREDKNNEPEDRNDHTINASQYGWLPYVPKIGVNHEHNKQREKRNQEFFED